MKSQKAITFTKRMNKLSRYATLKLIPKRNLLIEEFKAKELHHNGMTFIVDNNRIVWDEIVGKYKVV